MSCRETAAGRALTRIAREGSGLSDVQVLSLVHHCRREFAEQHGRPRPATPAERAALLDHLRLQQHLLDHGDHTYSDADVRRIRGNLNDAITAATSDTLTNADVHVWTNIEREAVTAANARDVFLTAVADRRHTPVQAMSDVYAAAMAHANRERSPGRRTEPLPLTAFGDYAPMAEQAPGDFRTRNVLHRIMQYGDTRCPACGQYAAVDGHHDCPHIEPTPAPTDFTAPTGTNDPMIGGVLNRGRARTLTGDPSADIPIPAQPSRDTVEDPDRPLRINNRIYRATNGAVTVTMPSGGGLRLAMADEGSQRTIPVRAATSDGHTVTGDVNLTSQLRSVSRGGQPVPGRDGRWRTEFDVTESQPRSLQCDCPAYRANYDCEHVRNTIAQVATVMNGREVPPAVPPAAAVANARALLTEEYDRSVDGLNGVTPDVAPMGAGAATPSGYTVDPVPFLHEVGHVEARTREGDYALPYYTENVLGPESAPGGPRTFGLELEIDFPNEPEYEHGESKGRVAAALAEAGLSQHNYALPWHYVGRDSDSRGREMGGGYSDDPHTWTVEFDRSVDEYDGRRGCEIKSPIMYDTPETWENLRKVCQIIQENGGTVTARTGLHVNIGCGDLDHTVGHYNRVAQLGASYEDVLVRMSTSPEKGASAHRGRTYCGSVVAPAEGFESISELKYAQGSSDDERHRRFINFAHVPNEGQRVRNSTRLEMRLFDGTVDPGRIQAAVRLSAGLVQAAAEGRGPVSPPEPAGTHRARIRAGQRPSATEDSATARELIDLIGGSPQGKAQLAQMWGQSPWSNR